MTAEASLNWFQTWALEFGPKILIAIAILIAAYFIGKLLAKAADYVIDESGLGGKETDDGTDLGDVVGNAVFWVTMLLAIPLVLGQLGLTQLLDPLQAMTTKFLNFVPNLFAGGLIFAIGFAIATIVKNAVTGVLKAAQVDEMPQKLGLTDMTSGASLSKGIGVLLFTLIIIPVAITALDKLQLDTIAGPAKEMLSRFLLVIPNIIVAAIVLGLAVLIGRFAKNALQQFLPTFGVDKFGEKVGIMNRLVGETKLSTIAGNIAFFAITLFGLVEAAKLLNFAVISDNLAHLVSLGGHILLGSLIILFGVVIADFISDIVANSKEGKPVAGFVKIAIIILASAMGLQQMGIANEIIQTGFTALIGALAVGSAIAIGLGGKETASRLLEKWTKDF